MLCIHKNSIMATQRGKKCLTLGVSSMVSTGFKAERFSNSNVIFLTEIIHDFYTGLMINIYQFI